MERQIIMCLPKAWIAQRRIADHDCWKHKNVSEYENNINLFDEYGYGMQTCPYNSWRLDYEIMIVYVLIVMQSHFLTAALTQNQYIHIVYLFIYKKIVLQNYVFSAESLLIWCFKLRSVESSAYDEAKTLQAVTPWLPCREG